MRRMERCLKEAYAAYMTQFKAIASWTEKENELLGWYRKMQKAAPGLRERYNPQTSQGEAYTRSVRMRFWNIGSRGEGNNPPYTHNPPETKDNHEKGEGGGKESLSQREEKAGAGKECQRKAQEETARHELQGQETAGKAEDGWSNKEGGHDRMRPGTTNFPAPFNQRMGRPDGEGEEAPPQQRMGRQEEVGEEAPPSQQRRQERGGKEKTESIGEKSIPKTSRIMEDNFLFPFPLPGIVYHVGNGVGMEFKII